MDLKIVRLAMRRMLVTSKRPKPIVPLVPKKKFKLGVTHRKPK